MSNLKILFNDRNIYVKARATFLLDLFTGAAVAYSLRKLKSTTVNVVRVRRSSDNAEQDFRASQITDGTLTTFCGAGNGFVSIWYDQSGNSNNAFQSNASNQPKIVNIGSLILENLKPTIQSDGNDILKTTNTNIFNSTSNLTAFSVAKDLSNNTSNDFLFGITNNAYGSSDDSIVLRKFNPNFSALLVNNALASSSDILKDANQNLLSFIYKGGISVIFKKNITTIINNTVPVSVNATKELEILSGIGTILGGVWNLQEMILWKTDLTTQRDNINNEINNYYTIY
jgi:hypothetical protein